MKTPASLGATLASRLFDDAALFPPGNAPMAEAVPAHIRLHGGREARFVGPFVVTDRRLAEFVETVGRQAGRFRLRVSLIATDRDTLPDAIARLRGDDRIQLTAIETAVSGAADRTAEIFRTRDVADVPVFVEPGWDDDANLTIAAAAAQGARIKLRTGGTSADAFPSAARLADAIATCLRLGVPFKCTAGLHQAVRHTDPATGFEHHGFLNICVAAAVGPSADLAPILEERDGITLVRLLADLDVDTGRTRFLSFGTCSIAEPLTDLAALGLLPGAAAP